MPVFKMEDLLLFLDLVPVEGPASNGRGSSRSIVSLNCVRYLLSI